MISPHTPPGTEVVAVADAPPANGLPGVKRGCVYVVDRIWQAADGESERFGVTLIGHGLGKQIVRVKWFLLLSRKSVRSMTYRLSLFRYLEKAATPEFYALAAPVDDARAEETRAAE